MRFFVVPLLAASCFSPDARDGLRCSEAGDCPPGQSCQIGICSSGTVTDATPLDAATADAAPPPPGDFTDLLPVALLCPGPMPCADVRDPFLTADTTTILFTYSLAAPTGNSDIYLSTRGDPGQTFPMAGSIGAINTSLAEHAPFLSADGKLLWFARQDLSTGAQVPPYDQILLGERDTGPFDSAGLVEGGVNTLLGDERSPQISADGQAMLFTRAPEKAPLDHDVYLARLEGGQWNTVERVDALSLAGANERSVALVEQQRTIFYIRDDQIHEAQWIGDDPTAIAVDVVHEELDAVPLDSKIGLWASPSGAEIWFDSSRGGPPQIYRAVRPVPTGAGGRIRRRPIP